MKRCLLLYAVAWFVPALVMTVAYLVVGAAPVASVIGGTLGGFVGLLGASSVLLLQTLLRRRDEEAELDEALEWLRQAQEFDYDRPPEHEGLCRLYEDVRREQERYPLRQVTPPEDEPPERG